jgi:NAD(P)-dependent dehydrogenase (short-subunit alcohol dehydrogenase family)
MESSVVLITGGISGIGRATALAYARSGARIVIAGRRADVGDAVVAELRASTDATFIKTDVRVEADVKNLVDKTLDLYGRLDIAVNNAGTEGDPGPVVDQDEALYRATFDTNVLGVLLSMKHELLAMIRQGSGSIVNISSSMGHKAAANASLYTASKHAVEGLSKAAALEVAGRGIRVNVVAPGPIDTDMLDRFSGTPERKASLKAGVPMQRIGNVEEIADAIMFIASPKAPFITGNVLCVDGGKSAG